MPNQNDIHNIRCWDTFGSVPRACFPQDNSAVRPSLYLYIYICCIFCFTSCLCSTSSRRTSLCLQGKSLTSSAGRAASPARAGVGSGPGSMTGFTGLGPGTLSSTLAGWQQLLDGLMFSHIGPHLLRVTVKVRSQTRTKSFCTCMCP